MAAEELTIWPGSPVVESMETGLESSAEAVVVGSSEESQPHTPATVVRNAVNDHSLSAYVQLPVELIRRKWVEEVSS